MRNSGRIQLPVAAAEEEPEHCTDPRPWLTAQAAVCQRKKAEGRAAMLMRSRVTSPALVPEPSSPNDYPILLYRKHHYHLPPHHHLLVHCLLQPLVWTEKHPSSAQIQSNNRRDLTDLLKIQSSLHKTRNKDFSENHFVSWIVEREGGDSHRNANHSQLQ